MNPNDYEIKLWCSICSSNIGTLTPTPPDHRIVQRIGDALSDHMAEAHTGRSPISIAPEPRHEIRYEAGERQPWAVYFKGKLVSREASEQAAMLYVAGAPAR